jgi:hypothetical protein
MEKLIEQIEGQANLQLELLKLKTVEKTVNTLPDLLYNALVYIILFLLITLFSIGTSLWINHEYGNNFIGFFVVSVFYILLTFSILLMRSSIQKRIKTKIINCLLNE